MSVLMGPVDSLSICACMRIGPSASMESSSTEVSLPRVSAYSLCLNPELFAISLNLVVELEFSCPPVVSFLQQRQTQKRHCHNDFGSGCFQLLDFLPRCC